MIKDEQKLLIGQNKTVVKRTQSADTRRQLLESPRKRPALLLAMVTRLPLNC